MKIKAIVHETNMSDLNELVSQISRDVLKELGFKKGGFSSFVERRDDGAYTMEITIAHEVFGASEDVIKGIVTSQLVAEGCSVEKLVISF